MLEKPLGIIAPHYCCSCDRVGSLLCEYCKYDITSEAFERCIVCGGPTESMSALCKEHVLPYSLAWCVGERSEALLELINSHKFERGKDAYRIFAELLDQSLPVLPNDIIVVPVPTIPAHIRQRGYDHTALMAHEFAGRRHLNYDTVLQRKCATVQLGKGKRQRRAQAKEAFRVDADCRDGRYLVLDDIFTSGATVEFAAKALRDAGAAEVWVAVVARQPMEN